MEIEVLWEQIVSHGMEHLLLRADDSIEADGVAVGVLEESPYRIRYHVTCDRAWNVKAFTVESLLAEKRVSLKRSGRDWIDEAGRPQSALGDCTEVDIMVTPFTNTLPIRRLGLRPGQSTTISVAYVSVPDLEVTRADQVYTGLGRQGDGMVVRYQSLSSGFTADLLTDAEGLVTDYPGIFRLVWRKTAA